MANVYPLNISISPENWRLFSLRKTDKTFEKFSSKVIERDNFTCRFCGFRATSFQEVVNLDGDYQNNKLSNLVTACCICMQCFFLNSVGKSDFGGGTLIYLPEISQNDLNGFCHVLFCIIANNTTYRSDAQNIYRDLKMKSQLVENNFGEGLSDPVMFSRAFVSFSTSDQNRIKQSVLPHLRLLPSYTKFNKQILTFSKVALRELSSKSN